MTVGFFTAIDGFCRDSSQLAAEVVLSVMLRALEGKNRYVLSLLFFKYGLHNVN